MTTVSVCVVTKNEAHNIDACLKSVAWADEIIVVDSHSEDDTVAKARQYTDNIVVDAWKGCGPQKQQACALATCDWILILDADERISPALAQEIQQTLHTPKHAGYRLPFQSYFLGQPIRFGDWMREQHLRLFKRNQAQVIPRLVHFRVEVAGSIGTLTHKIQHYSFPDMATVVDKMNRYSTDGARHLHQQGRKAGLSTAIGHGVFAFVRSFVLRLGFLDGRYGFLLAIAIAEGAYYKYVKLQQLQHVGATPPHTPPSPAAGPAKFAPETQ